MKYIKVIKSLAINNYSGDTETVPEGAQTIDALFDIENEDIVSVGDETFVPFHAILTGDVETRTEWDAKPDGFYKKDCDAMETPVIIGQMPEIDVMAGEEFDPLVGITAKDDNGEVIPVEVTVEGD